MQKDFLVNLLHPYLPGGTQWGLLDPIVVGDNQEYEIERIIPIKIQETRLPTKSDREGIRPWRIAD